MENTEEDAGSLADASRLASARERNIGQREDNAMSECSVDGASSPMLDLTTETLLHMIDELVDEPRAQQLSANAATATAAVVSESSVTSSSSTSTVTSSNETCDSNSETSYQSNCEQPKQVPKLTIKLSGKQQTVIPNSSHKFNEVYTKSSSSEISESDSSENDESASTSDQAPITGKIITESVPKVTIKLGKPGTECEGKFYAQQNVPKLTIKTHDLESEEESVTKIKLKVSQQEEKSPEKIPKLTIKTITKPENQQLSPKLLIKPNPKLENQQVSPKLTIKPIPKPDNQLSPKLTIKPIKPPENAYNESHFDSYETPQIPKLKISQDYISLRECKDSAQVPKITIKPVFKPECETHHKTSKKGTSKCDDNETNQKTSKKNTNKCDDNETNQKTSKKVTNKCDDNETHQKTSKKVTSKFDDNATNQKSSKKLTSKCDDNETNQKTSKKLTSQTDDNEHIPVVTKINIKPIQKPVESDCSSDYSNHSGEEKIHIVSKLNIKPIIKTKEDEANHAESEIPKIKKLNIKPIINPATLSEQKNCCSWSSFDKNIPVITKLNIKPVVEPSSEETSKDSENQSSETGNSSDDNNDQIPIVTKLNIKPVVKPSYVEPLTIRPVPLDESSVPVVTKINIKPVLKPDENTLQVSPKKTGHRSPNYPDYIPLVTKLNIKPVISPYENQPEDTPKNPPLLMKIRTNPDNTSSSELQINKRVLSTEYEPSNAIESTATVSKNSPKSYSKTNNEIQTDPQTHLKCDEQTSVKKSNEVTYFLENDFSDPQSIVKDLNSLESILKSIPVELPAADTDSTYTQSNDNESNSHETAEEPTTADYVKEKSQTFCDSNDFLEAINSHKTSGNGISDLKLNEAPRTTVDEYENQDYSIDNRDTEQTLEENLNESSDIYKSASIDVNNDTIGQSAILSIVNKKQPQKRRRKGAKLHASPPKRMRSSRIASKMQKAESTRDLNEETSAPGTLPHEKTRSKLCELLSNKPLPPIPTSNIENIQDNAKSPLQNTSNFDSTRRTDVNSYLSTIEDKLPETRVESRKDENWPSTPAIELECNDASTASSDVLDVAPLINSHSQNEGILLNDSSACDYSANISNLHPVGLDDINTTVEIAIHKKEEVFEKPQPKKRGRPRKKPLPVSEQITETPISLTPAIEERPQRSARLSRGTPTVKRTPRRRGRGRGGPNRVSSDFSQLSPQLDITIETNEKSPEGKVGTHLDIDPTSSTVKLPRMTEVLNKMPSIFSSPLSRRKSGMENESSLASGELETPSRPLRGKGSRGGRYGPSRGARRARGGGRGATYMKETMGIYGRVCGPATTTIGLLEEETCMMDDNATQAKPNLLLDDDSQSSVKSSTNDSNKGKRARIDFSGESIKLSAAAHVKEYHWTDGKLFMIQEQVSLFLGVRSFNLQYPQLKRRKIVGEELAYLQDKGIVTLGTTAGDLTAVDASEVLDIMLSDYPHKYEEFRSHQRLRQRMGLEDVRPDRIEMKMELKSVEPKVEPPKIDPEKLRLEIAAQARAAAAEYNTRLNMQRFKSCADLQNMQIQRRRPMPPPAPPPNVVPPCGLYPLALLPGQYQHTYLRYTPEQLRYFPLNTALDAPPPPARQATTDTESDAEWCLRSSSDEDSDNEHSSSAKRIKLSSSKRSSLGGSGIKEESSESTSRNNSQSAWIEGVDTCRMCGLREEANRKYSHERFLACSQCHSKMHPSCLELGPDTIRKCRDYAWQCAECKTCYGCHLPADDDKMLFCDLCDRGFHIYCVGLDKVPSGRWHCVECALCKSCGARDAAGLPEADSAAASTPEWHHRSKRGAGGHKVYSHSLCTPCARKSKIGHRPNANSKTFQVEEKSWDAGKNAHRIGRYCPLCERSFIGPKGTMQLVICKLCDRQLHQECVKQTVSNLNVLDYTCADCRRGGITSRAAAVRLAPRTIATLFMAKRRFNKYAHRQYMRSRQKDKQEEPAVAATPDNEMLETEEDATTDIDTETQADIDTETQADIDTETQADTFTELTLDDLDAPIEIDADPSTDMDSLSELDVDSSRMIEAEQRPLDDDIDETVNAVKALQMNFD